VEEAQHALLGWDVVEWSLQRHGEPLRRELLAALDEVRLPRCDDLPEHGRVGRALVQPRFDALKKLTRERLLTMRAATPRALAAVPEIDAAPDEETLGAT